MKKEEILKGIENKEAQKQYLAKYNLAKDALNRNDTQELFILYEEAVKHRGQLLAVICILNEHNSSKIPRIGVEVNEDVVKLMENVALAAIELAKSSYNKK